MGYEGARPKYTTATEAMIMNESGLAITRLLDRKVQEAKEAMVADIDRQLWGLPRQQGKSLLHQIISDAYDQHVYGKEPMAYPTYASGAATINSTMLNSYTNSIKDNVFKESAIIGALKREKEVSVTKELRAEINHAKEVKRVTRELKKFEGSWLYKLQAGAHIGFKVQFEEDGTKYSYAGIFDGKRWHLTGARSPQAISTDDLVDWLIDHNVSFGKVSLYVKAS
jgi:hypothetical protein